MQDGGENGPRFVDVPTRYCRASWLKEAAVGGEALSVDVSASVEDLEAYLALPTQE